MTPIGYACPENMIWTPEERLDDKKRQCTGCAKVCDRVYCRIYSPGGFVRPDNLCSHACWKKHVDRLKIETIEDLNALTH